ncbi:MAG: GNAT family N-acetyltransferase [Anaerolineae bacterium]|nr:GNAT family N-acetyltransferase [Anaerolineae bacterium]MDW8173008.1 GNAT family N-acetyltransferase [Anaerolineae bacterium]
MSVIDETLLEQRWYTERLLLRAPQPGDAVHIYHLARDRRVSEMLLNMPHPYERYEADAWVERARVRIESGEGLPLVIVRRADDQLIGSVGLWPNYLHRRAELGYWLGVTYWGRGYMSEAVQTMIDFGFAELGLNRIFATYFTNNPASMRVMLKCGMVFEGVQRQAVIKWGEARDLGMCAILRQDWLRRKQP